MTQAIATQAAPTVAAVLQQLDRGRAALAEATTNVRRLQIRDGAAALAAFAEILKRRDVQVLAAELVMDAERAIAKANPPKKLKRKPDVTAEVISEPPVSVKVLSTMRAAHKLDDESYEAAKAEAREEGEPLTRAKLVQATRPAKPPAAQTPTTPPPLPSDVYRTVVIDPPWPVEKIARVVRPNQVAMPYRTMSVEEITRCPVRDLLAPDAFVFLWTTQKYLPASFRCLEAWGLTYRYTLVWKKPGGFQPYNSPQYNGEFVVVGSRGNPRYLETKAFPTVFDAPRGAHSEKPEVFYETLRRVTESPRLDMFNRRAIEGFEGWGDQAK